MPSHTLYTGKPKNSRDLLFAIFALLGWSGSEPAVPPRLACVHPFEQSSCHTLPRTILHLVPKVLPSPGPWLALPSSRLHCHSHSQQRVFELIVKFSSTSSSLGTNYLSLKSANFPIRVSVCTCDLEIITIWKSKTYVRIKVKVREDRSLL